MSTRSLIGVYNSETDRVRWIYCHFDGYPNYVGRILMMHYTEQLKIEQLIALGDISSLGIDIGEKVDFNARREYTEDNRALQCVAYHRDRGERLRIESGWLEEFHMAGKDVDYLYLWRDGLWQVRGHNYAPGIWRSVNQLFGATV